jgi:peptidoglycan hydrolase CwlO-like protein
MVSTETMLLILTFVSVAAAIYFGVKAANRDDKQDSEGKAIEMAKISVKLDGISDDIHNVQAEIKEVKNQMQDDHDKLIGVDKSLKSLWSEFNKHRDVPIDPSDE